MTKLQTSIIELLSKKEVEHLTASEIAWELKTNQMHIGNSIKSLVKKGLVHGYTPYSHGGNPKYFLL